MKAWVIRHRFIFPAPLLLLNIYWYALTHNSHIFFPGMALIIVLWGCLFLVKEDGV